MRVSRAIVCCFVLVLALSSNVAVEARRKRAPKTVWGSVQSSFLRIKRQVERTIPFDPSPRWLRSHSDAIIAGSVGVLVLAWLVSRRQWSGPQRAVLLDAVPGAAAAGARPRRAIEQRSGLLRTTHDDVRTLSDLLVVAAREHGDRPCWGTRACTRCDMSAPRDGKPARRTLTLGEYRWTDYARARTRALELGVGLRESCGVRAGDTLAIYADTCEEWMLAAHAAWSRGLVVSTVYANLGEEALVFALNETRARAVVTEAASLETVLRALPRLEHVRAVVVATGGARGDADVSAADERAGAAVRVLSLADAAAAGVGANATPHVGDRDDTAVIMYTSGSTGQPKGVEIAHGAILSAAAGLRAVMPHLGETDTYMAHLPLAHILELIAETAAFSVGAAVGYGSPFTLVDGAPALADGVAGDAPTLRPTVMAGVPKIFATMRAKILKKVSKSGKLASLAFHAALRHKYGAIAVNSSTPITDAVFFRKTAAVLGGRLRLLVSGGGPLDGDTEQFIKAVFCCDVSQGYALTETCGAGTVSRCDDPALERVGSPVGCCDIRLVGWDEYSPSDSPRPRGEVWLAGPCLAKGYFQQPELTRESFVDGEDGQRWFRSGDIGEWHPDGTLKIIGRCKDIVKLDHGEYLSLGKVDAVLGRSAHVSAVCTHAHSGAPFAVAVVSVSEDALSKLAKQAGSDAADPKSQCADEAVQEELVSDFRARGKEAGLQRWEIPRRVVLTTKAWTPDNGLVTAAMKLRRGRVVKHYEEQIEKLFNE